MIEKLTGHRKTKSRGAIVYPPSSLEIYKKVNEIIDFLNSDSVVKVTEKDCCPVESKDERMRKHIIEILRRLAPCHFDGNERSECIAWLEKQAEHANFRNKIQIGDKVTRNEDGVLVNLSQLKRVAKKDEKQGEQKPALEIKTPEESLGIDSETYNKIVDECIYGEQKPAEYTLEQAANIFLGALSNSPYNNKPITDAQTITKQLLNFLQNPSSYNPDALIANEQKPADKVEPKFHEGEWLVHNDLVGVTFCITQIHAPHYYLTNNNSFIKFGEEDNYRPWTIQDAKDGDVIYSRHNTESFEWIGIFKSLDKENKRVFFYGFWHDMAKTFMVCGKEAYVLYDDFSPATKEQRDTLEKAMADAGYTFDFEKKELKKIEQKLVEEVNGEDYGIDGLYVAMDILNKTFGQVEGYQSDDGILEHKAAMTAVKKMYKQKPTEWSEEDIKYIDSINHYLEASASGAVGELEETLNKDIEFLKSLKDRYVPQTKQEWSEEDEAILENVIKILDGVTKGITADITLKEIHSFIVFLRSLRPQSRWKPSDEQMEVLNEVIRNPYLSTAEYNGLIALREQLKAL